MMCAFRNLTRENELQSKGLKIELVDHGIASRIDDTIEVNRALTTDMWEDLYASILEHELQHDSGMTTLKDFKLDIFQQHKDIFKFMYLNKNSWTVMKPISKRGEDWIINHTLLVVYGIIALPFIALAFL